MMRTTSRIVAALAVVVLAAGCSDETIIFPGGPAGPATNLDVANADIVMVIGQTTQVGATVRDSAGNPTGANASFSACNSAISVSAGTGTDATESVANVSASGLGVSCVTVSGGGLSDSIGVVVGPAGITITGPDTIGSGEEGQFEINPVDASGAALSGSAPYQWSTTSVAQLATDPATGLAQGRGIGTAAIQARAPGGAGATKTITIVPGTFMGSLSANAGDPGEIVTVTAGADAFDDDTFITYGGVLPWVESASTSEIAVAVPATGATGNQELLISAIGPDQLAKTTEFNSGSAFGDTYQPGNVSDAFAPPGPVPDLATVATANGNIYFAHGGFGTGSASRGAFNGGGQIDHYFAFTGPADFDALLEWTNGSDVDVYICDQALTTCPFAFFSGSSTQEDASGISVGAGDWWLIVSMWDAGSDITNFRLNVSGL